MRQGGTKVRKRRETDIGKVSLLTDDKEKMSGTSTTTPGKTSSKTTKPPTQQRLEPLVENRKKFSKKDLTDAVRKLAPAAQGSVDQGLGAARVAASFDVGESKKGGDPLQMMEFGVNYNARKFNELRTQADEKAALLKKRLDTLRTLKNEKSSLKLLGKPDTSEARRIQVLLKEIEATSDDIDRRHHYRRQLEQMLTRLQKNQIAIRQHVHDMDFAYEAATKERDDMEASCRQLEAGRTKAVLELAEAQRLYSIEKGERTRAVNTKKTEAQQATRMDAWRKKRELARREFASELRGDLSKDEEQKLQHTLTRQKRALLKVRNQHEVLQKEATALESAFVAVRQATGANSLDEVVSKFQHQEGNRKALTNEKREAEDRLANAKKAKDDLDLRFADLKASGIGSTETTRDIADQLEREILASRIELKASNACCERLENVLVALRQGAVGLYQRLRPFANLLEGEGSIPTAALKSSSSETTGTPQPTTTTTKPPQPATTTAEPPALDSMDAIHLSEIMLSKMVEILSGGEAADHVCERSPLPAEDEDVGDGGLPYPENNVRVASNAEKQRAEVDDVLEALEPPPRTADESIVVAAVKEETTTFDCVGGLSNATAATLEDMVPSRTFLKLSSSRQHSEMLRRLEQEARKKRMMDRMELAEETDRIQMSSRAARKKAQAEANDRLSAQPTTYKPPTNTKQSAVERSATILTKTPDLD